MAAGTNLHCAVTMTGSVLCWGQMLPPNHMTAATPTEIIASGATAVALSNELACALMSDDTIDCWGRNNSGILDASGTFGGNDVENPTQVPGVSDVAQLAIGTQHACVRQSTGAVLCWGAHYPDAGYLGIGSGASLPPDPESDSIFPPVVVPLAATASDLSAGETHTCAVVDGIVFCWGQNEMGQLGDGTTNWGDSPVATSVTNATSVSAGSRHTCARLTNGNVVCWGANDVGQLGRGTTSTMEVNAAGPVGLGTVTALSAGADHTCAILSAGGFRCWGSNGSEFDAGALCIGLQHDVVGLPE